MPPSRKIETFPGIYCYWMYPISAYVRFMVMKRKVNYKIQPSKLALYVDSDTLSYNLGLNEWKIKNNLGSPLY